jgi:hypothetical protein
VNDTVEVKQINERAKQIDSALRNLLSSSEDNLFDMCDLLFEANDNHYHNEFGFLKFGDWIDASGFDISARQAAYLVNVGGMSLHFNVDRPTLKLIKISKLKEIFSLDKDEHSAEIRELLEKAPGMTYEEVKARVRGIKGGPEAEDMVFMTLRFPSSAKPVIDRAFEQVRVMNGDYIVNGEVVELPNGLALERMAAEFLSGIQEEEQATAEWQEEEEVDAAFGKPGEVAPIHVEAA